MTQKRDFKRTLQHIRHLSQIIFFVLLVVIVVGSVCSLIVGGVSITEPLGALQIALAGGTSIPQTVLLTLISSVLIFLVTVIIFGRAFCAWACPISAINDLQEYIMNKRHFREYVARKPRNKKEGRLQKALRNRENKYAVLGGVIASSVLTRSPAWCDFCPIGTICRGTVAGGFIAGAEMLIIGAVVAASTYEKRFFCKYICPVAGLISAVSRLNFFIKPKVSREGCNTCGSCAYICPEGLDVCNEKTFAECTKCFVCYSKCPYGVIGIGLRSTDKNKMLPPSQIQT